MSVMLCTGVISTLKVLNFCGYLISQLEKKNILRVFNFAIWWLQNISQVFNFAFLLKIRKDSLIEYQFFLFLINVIVIKYVTETRGNK